VERARLGLAPSADRSGAVGSILAGRVGSLDVDLGGRSLLGGFGYGGGLKVVIGVVIVVIVDERGGKEGVVKGAEDERRLLVMVLGGCHRFVVHLHLPLLLLGVALLLLLLTLLTCSSYRSRELTESGRDFGETG
jgi:hypothetical protein